MLWLGVARHQAMIWTNEHPYLCCHMAMLIKRRHVFVPLNFIPLLIDNKSVTVQTKATTHDTHKWCPSCYLNMCHWPWNHWNGLKKEFIFHSFPSPHYYCPDIFGNLNVTHILKKWFYIPHNFFCNILFPWHLLGFLSGKHCGYIWC